jgi:hypothetical protein
MPYPFGSQTQTPGTVTDLPYTLLQRRQGDVKATLIPITLNGQPVNIGGFTFHFSVTLPSGVQDVVWSEAAPQSGTPITTVTGAGFTVPPFNATVSVAFGSTAQMSAGSYIFIPGAGAMSILTVTDPTNAVLLNPGFYGNFSSGSITSGTNVYKMGQVGMTVLIIPKSVSSNPVGLYPFYCKFDTNDPFPGPYVVTFLQGSLQILTQNNPLP